MVTCSVELEALRRSVPCSVFFRARLPRTTGAKRACVMRFEISSSVSSGSTLTTELSCSAMMRRLARCCRGLRMASILAARSVRTDCAARPIGPMPGV